jgi:hypothetical protein
MPTVVMSRVTETGIDRAVLSIATLATNTGMKLQIRSVVEVRVNDILLRAEPCNVAAGVEEMKRAMTSLKADGYEVVSVD